MFYNSLLMEMEKVRNRVQIQYCVASFLTETMSLHQCRQMAARCDFEK